MVNTIKSFIKLKNHFCFVNFELEDIVDHLVISESRRRGLYSTINMSCCVCEAVLQKVPTIEEKQSDINGACVLGAMSGGIGFSHVTEVLAFMNIFNMDDETWLSYEMELTQKLVKLVARCCRIAERENGDKQ